MDPKISQFLEQGQLDKALGLAKKFFEKAAKSEKAYELNSSFPVVRLLVRKLCQAESVYDCKNLVDQFLELLAVAPQLKPRYYAQLGINDAAFAAIERRQLNTASKLIDLFNLVGDENEKLVAGFLNALLQQGEYKMAADWALKLQEPSILTIEKLVRYMVSRGRVSQGLQYIKDYNLNEKGNAFDVPSLIVQLIKKGGIVEAIQHIKDFKMNDDENSENPKYPAFRDVNLVNALFHSCKWEQGLAFIARSSFKSELEETFNPVTIVLLMIKKRDMVELAKYLKTPEVVSLLDKPIAVEKPNEKPPTLKQAIVQELLLVQEVGKATKYAIKFDLLDDFPLDTLFDKLIRRHEFGVLTKLISKYNLEEKTEHMKHAIEINRIMSLKHFRRRFGVLPAKKAKLGSNIVSQKEFQRMEFSVMAELAPLADDEYLVHTDNEFFRFLAESNATVELCQNSKNPFSPRVSPRLQDYVERKLAAEQERAMAAEASRGFKINAGAAVWQPQSSLESQFQSMNIGSISHESSMGPSSRPNENSLYNQLKRATSFDSVNGATPPGFSGQSWDPQQQQLRHFRTNQRAQDVNPNMRTRTFEDLQAQGPYYDQQRSTPGLQRVSSYDSLGGRSGSGLYGSSDDLQRVQAQQQRMLQLQRMQAMQRQERERNDLYELTRREKIEKIIAALLNLHREAQLVSRNVAVLVARNKQAYEEGDSRQQAFIRDEYRKLQVIKDQHRMKEKKVLMAARTDPDVAEALVEFKNRRRMLASQKQQLQQQQQQQQQQFMSDHQARQLHRLRQHEMEKQRQLQLRVQQQEKEGQRRYQGEHYMQMQHQKQHNQQQRNLLQHQQRSSQFSPELGFRSSPSLDTMEQHQRQERSPDFAFEAFGTKGGNAEDFEYFDFKPASREQSSSSVLEGSGLLGDSTWKSPSEEEADDVGFKFDSYGDFDAGNDDGFGQ